MGKGPGKSSAAAQLNRNELKLRLSQGKQNLKSSGVKGKLVFKIVQAL